MVKKSSFNNQAPLGAQFSQGKQFMQEIIYFHELTFTDNDNMRVTDLLIGTESAIARLMPHYADHNYKLVTLWHVTDFDRFETVNYRNVRIIR